MAKTRSQQRAAAKARQRAKQDRLENRAEAYRNQVVRETVRRNMDNPPERNYYPSSCLDGFAAKLHSAREYKVSTGTTVKERPANIAKPKPLNDPWSWRTVDKRKPA
jgi:vacuolar-type H+-ATPase subunit E/Vma4